MAEWFTALDAMEVLFLLCALAGGLPLIVMFIMQVVGAGHDADMDYDSDFDMEVDGADVGHSADFADLSFKFMSFKGLTSFLMMFGLVGFPLYRQNHFGPWISIAGGVVAGLLSVWVMSRLFKSFSKLQSSGTMQTARAVGSKGEVYLTIKEGTTGMVTINFQDRLREFEAVSVNGKELKTGTRVEVVEVSGSTLVVREIK